MKSLPPAESPIKLPLCSKPLSRADELYRRGPDPRFLLACSFDIQLFQDSAFNNGYATLFRLRNVDQHFFFHNVITFYF